MITSSQNPLVKQLRKLHRPKERRQQHLCLLEGTHLLEAALETAQPLETICHTSDWQERYPQLWHQASQQARRLELVSAEVLRAIATTVEPDGVVATMPRLHTQPLTIQTLGLAIATLQDPGNLGTIIRTTAAAGAEGLWLSADSVDLDHPKVLRASAGQWFRLPMAISPDLETEITQCRTQGIQVIATLPQAPITYWQVNWQRPTLILLGNEGAGLPPNLIALADQQVRIPLSSGVESLNVAIAAALLLFEAQRQRGFQ
ncbi:rRNA methyltransferase [Neosynechococcus sphagnicola sy1]|uniref:rRNA methyltransferase n=1 Tax=Neosynechococcus sphagnicola sy1 TaxID=1497020 RepID=A0A098TNX6_9CYAN|nr:RNA methyltransferase [Neosynechococcus sphagnicola]KGF72533.1 rRNA methyltransferase [Neosynechococcus sphagnicola sy1]